MPEPVLKIAPSLDELLEHVDALEELARETGYDHLATVIHVLSTRVRLDRPDFERRPLASPASVDASTL